MNEIKTINALGLMSKSSLDGITTALIATDGVDIYDTYSQETTPYDDELREKISKVRGLRPEDSEEANKRLLEVEQELTEFHAKVANEFISSSEKKVDIIGFRGHTTFRDPANHYINEIGSGKLLANLTKIDVINSFSRADIFAGGQGGPLYPAFHDALCRNFEKPVAVLTIGGTTSLTWLDKNGEMIAFETGPGTAQINDWVYKKGGQIMDYNGKLAITGTIDEKIVATLMRHKYFAKYPPKTADIRMFNDKLEHLSGLSLEDGAATVTAFVAESVAYAVNFYLPEQPKELIICGGGAKNPTLSRFIRQRLNNTEIKTGFDIGWDNESIEAQAFAYLAVRRLYNMPATFPSTTGAFEPIICGQIHKPE